MKAWAVLGMFVMPLAFAADPPQQQNCYHGNAAVERGIGYCKAIRSGNLLFISGQPAPGPMPDAIRSVYANLKQTLAAHDLTFADVVKETVYATDLDAFIKSNELRKPYYGGVLPTATWVEVRRLFNPALVLEVELVAIFPAGK